MISDDLIIREGALCHFASFTGFFPWIVQVVSPG